MRILTAFAVLLTALQGLYAQEEPAFIGGHYNDVTCITYSPDGEYIVTGSWDGQVFVFVNDTSPYYYMSFEDHSNAVTSLAFSRDSRKLLTSGIDGKVHVYNFPHPDSSDYISMDTTYEFSNKAINKVFYGPGLRMIFAADDGGVFHAYDIKKKVDRSIKAEGPIKTFAVSIDRMHYFIATKGSSEIIQYNILGKEIRRFEGHAGEVNDLEVTVDRKYLISASADQTIKIWNLQTGKMAISLSKHHNWNITSLSVDPYSRYIASCGLDGLVNIYEIATGKLLKSIENDNGRCNEVAFSPDITKVAVALHMDNPGDDGYGSNIWSTGLERPKAAPAPKQSKAVRRRLQRAKTGARKNSTPTKQETKANKTQSVLHKSEQIEITIDN